MKKGRLLLPWGLLAGLLLWTATIEGLGIKPVSVLKKPRNFTTNHTITTTTTTTTEATELTSEGEDEEVVVPDGGADSEGNVTGSNSLLTGDPQRDYKYDPNLPRELPHGYNLSTYPFFSRVPNDVAFVCEDDMLDGYYANVHYKCQVYHHCLSGIRYDFLCANYTAFDQKTFICHFVSEVDCANSAKFWGRNKGLYETPTTTTVKPLTLPPPPPPPPQTAPRRPVAAAAGGRRRRPYRRRRPQYDYYYDDDYEEDDYDDDLTAPAQQHLGRSNNRNRAPQRPSPAVVATPSSLDASPSPSDPGVAADDKPFKADSSIYDRPRQAPKIRRPVPVAERDKYDYPRKEEEKKVIKEEEPERDYDRPSPRPRQKARPPQDDDEYYDDDDYDLPRSTSGRKNNNNNQEDYYAPSAPDRDFGRRPAMSGAGRPLRRNRQGARRRPADEYDYDDRRPPATPEVESRRRPSETEARRRPVAYDDEEPVRRRPTVSEDGRRRQEDAPRRRPNDEARRRPDDEERRRPDDDSRRRPDDQPRRRPEEDSRRKSNSEEDSRTRPTESEEVPKRRLKEDEEPRRRPLSSEEDVRRKPSTEDEPRRRPAVEEEPYRRRPTTSEEDVRKVPSSSEAPTSRRRSTTTETPRRGVEDSVEEDFRRKPAAAGSRSRNTPQRQEPERDVITTRNNPVSRGTTTKPQAAISQDYSYDTVYNDRQSSYVAPTGRGAANNDRQSALRQGNRDNRESSGKTSARIQEVVGERPAKESQERTQVYSDRPRPETPSGSDNLRQVAPPVNNARGRTPAEVESDLPIPAAKPAYISMLGREGYRKKVQDEETRLSTTAAGNTRVAAKPVEVVKTTEAPKPLYDDEYYYDDDEEIEEEVPAKPATGPEAVAPRGSQEAAVTKPLTGSSIPGTVSIVTLGPGDARIRGQSSEIIKRIGPITESQAKASLSLAEGRTKPVEPISSSSERSQPEERLKTRPTVQTSAKKPPSSVYHFDEDGVLLETSTRAGFRPKTTTTTTTQAPLAVNAARPATEEPLEDVHQRPLYQNNYRRKLNPPSSAENTKVLPTKTDVEDRLPPLGSAGNDNVKQKIASEVYRSSTEAPIRLETDIFEVPKLKFQTLVPAGPPSARGNINYRQNDNDPLPPRRPPVLPDITDPEYDVTLNEAVVHPTRNPFSAQGGSPSSSRIKVKVPVYHYRDAPVDFPKNKQQQATLLSSESQTHISKAVFPLVHEKYADSPKEEEDDVEEDYENTTGEDEYDDIPTGKGASRGTFVDIPVPANPGGQLKYEWTTYPTELRDRGSSIVTSRGTTGQQYVASNTPQYYQQQQSVTRGPIREFPQQQPYTRNSNLQQQYYNNKPATVDGYRAAAVNPLLFSQTYDYDLIPKYRPTRKYASFYGKPY